MEQMTMSLYLECLELGIPVDSHESDLYIPVNETTRVLLLKHQQQATTFVSQIDGALWYDVPFRFDPWWEKKAQRV
jgi:hypothetical protein